MQALGGNSRFFIFVRRKLGEGDDGSSIDFRRVHISLVMDDIGMLQSEWVRRKGIMKGSGYGIHHLIAGMKSCEYGDAILR
jgi:hypothetical protein